MSPTLLWKNYELLPGMFQVSGGSAVKPMMYVWGKLAAAFNQSIIQGANVLGNSVDMTLVGGSLTSTLIGEDDTGV